MAIRLVKDACAHNGNTATVVVEGDSVEEVTGLAAKQFVLKQAHKIGIHARGLNNSSGPYMVGMGDKVAVTPTDMARIVAEAGGAGGDGVWKFRNDFTIATVEGYPMQV